MISDFMNVKRRLRKVSKLLFFWFSCGQFLFSYSVKTTTAVATTSYGSVQKVPKHISPYIDAKALKSNSLIKKPKLLSLTPVQRKKYSVILTYRL